MDTKKDGALSWQDALYDLLRRNSVTQFAYVPDAGHRVLIDRSLAGPQARSVALPTDLPAYKRDMDPSPLSRGPIGQWLIFVAQRLLLELDYFGQHGNCIPKVTPSARRKVGS